MKSYKVSIQHDKTVSEMIQAALEDLGGINALVPPNKKVLIKPNLVIAKKMIQGQQLIPRLLKK